MCKNTPFFQTGKPEPDGRVAVPLTVSKKNISSYGGKALFIKEVGYKMLKTKKVGSV
jgi:hypothetical protein